MAYMINDRNKLTHEEIINGFVEAIENLGTWERSEFVDKKERIEFWILQVAEYRNEILKRMVSFSGKPAVFK